MKIAKVQTANEELNCEQNVLLVCNSSAKFGGKLLQDFLVCNLCRITLCVDEQIFVTGCNRRKLALTKARLI